jgi:hypothetical protein
MMSPSFGWLPLTSRQSSAVMSGGFRCALSAVMQAMIIRPLFTALPRLNKAKVDEVVYGRQSCFK